MTARSATARAARSYSCGIAPQAIHYEAAAATSGQYLAYNGWLTYGFYIAGDPNLPQTSCIDTANGSVAATEKYVTFNDGKSGPRGRADQARLRVRRRARRATGRTARLHAAVGRALHRTEQGPRQFAGSSASTTRGGHPDLASPRGLRGASGAAGAAEAAAAAGVPAEPPRLQRGRGGRHLLVPGGRGRRIRCGSARRSAALRRRSRRTCNHLYFTVAGDFELSNT